MLVGISNEDDMKTHTSSSWIDALGIQFNIMLGYIWCLLTLNVHYAQLNPSISQPNSRLALHQNIWELHTHGDEEALLDSPWLDAASRVVYKYLSDLDWEPHPEYLPPFSSFHCT